MRTFLALAAAAAAMAIAATHGTQAGQRLSASQIMRLFPGTFEAVYDDDTVVTIHATLDGRLQGRWGVLRDSGHWGLDGDRICIRWDTWLNGEVRCRHVVFVNGWYLAVNPQGRWKLRLRRTS